MNPYRSGAACGGGGEVEGEGEEHYSRVAARLLRDNFLLTALELHTELVECGRELPQLREFFSNPGNFEQHASASTAPAPAACTGHTGHSGYSVPARALPDNIMHRTPSQGTLDSLDMARYSEDGGADRGGSGGEVAVLEFELRKARETIHALRANLTQFADCDSSDKNMKGDLMGVPLKPHEKRALNFLVNEYLLLQEYKLTSITFSDENPDQDFEDWDDVGLNMPRPCSLISLFRGDSVTSKPATNDTSTDTDIEMTDFTCQTEMCCDEESICVSCQTSFDDGTDWNHEFLIQAEEIVLLKQQILALETDKLNFQKLYDAALASLNALTSPASENVTLDLNIPQERLLNVKKEQTLTLEASDNHYGSNASTNSVTPDQFEMIECEKNSGCIIQKEGSTTGWLEGTTTAADSARGSPLRRGSVTTLDETLSINDGGEWTRVQYEHNAETVAKDTWMHSSLPTDLKSSLLSWCSESSDATAGACQDLLAELCNNENTITAEGLITLVADTLPRILPHTLVSRRCEACALLVATIHLTPPSKTNRRAKVLQLLLTLIKRPDPPESRIITEAVCLLVKWGNSGEVLSCIAELLVSRSAERRVLASQICLSIAPYVPIDLCTSLLLSLITLMCESSELEIRQFGLKAAVLVCAVAEHKYLQLEGICVGMLKDPVEGIRRSCVRVFVPMLARSALLAGKFSTDLFPKITIPLQKACHDHDWKIIVQSLAVIKALVTPTLAYVINVQMVRESLQEDSTNNYQNVTLDSNEEIQFDLRCFVANYTVEPKLMIYSMNGLIKEKPDVRWPELSWFLEEVIKQLVQYAISSKCLTNASTYNAFITIMHNYCHAFGTTFTTMLVNPIFTEIIMDLEHKMEKLVAVSVDDCVVAGIYLAGVLPCVQDSKCDITNFLQRWIVCCGVCGLPVEVFATPLKWLSQHEPHVLGHSLHCLREIVAGSCGSKSGPSVRTSVASILSELANCADLPEVCVDTQVVPAVMALMHDDEQTVREKAIGALGSVTRLSVLRSLPCTARCWATLESVVERFNNASQQQQQHQDEERPAQQGEGMSREVARMADALALLVSQDTEAASAGICLKVLTLLCVLCHHEPLTGDVLSSLIPGLQLAIHLTRPNDNFIRDTLLEALSKLQKIDSPSLFQHKQAAVSLLASVSTTHSDTHTHAQRVPAGNILTGSEAVGRRVTQIFQHSKTNMSIPNIFKKKS